MAQNANSLPAIYMDGNRPGDFAVMTAEDAEAVNAQEGTNYFYHGENTPGALERAQEEFEQGMTPPEPTPVVLRVMRHPLDAERTDALKVVFGDTVEVVTEDVPYGDDPAGAVQDLIDMIESSEERRVVAVEAGGPEPKVIALVEALAELGIPLIRQAFQRGPDGRVVLTGQDERGRDIFAFGGYETVEVEVRKALVQRPLLTTTPAAT